MKESPHNIVEIMLQTPEGELEALLMLPIPEPAKYSRAAIICHPHPLYGGSMHTKVVFKASHAFLELGIPSLRFNFRGVGNSTGKYDNGRGELEDIRAAVDYMSGKAERIIIAGHSFGAWTGMKAGCMDPRVHMMIGIGNPFGLVDMSFMMECQKPKLFIHGTQDELIPVEKVEEVYRTLPEPKKLIRIEGADHMFTGKLGELAEAVRELTEEYLPESEL